MNAWRRMWQVAERLGLKLSKQAVEQAKTDAYIVDRLKAALHQLKQCRSKDEWLDYHIILAAIAPERFSAAEASKHRGEGRSIEKVCARLALNPKARYKKGSKEPRQPAIQKAITRRAEQFDATVDLQRAAPLKVGDAASSRGQPCTVVEIDHDADTCKLSFSSNGVEAVRSYTCIYKGKDARGKAPFPKGSARLRRMPPSLRPMPPAIRKDAKAETARSKVEELFDQEAARSPSQRDSVRRRLGVGLYETVQALVVYATNAALYIQCSVHAIQCTISALPRSRSCARGTHVVPERRRAAASSVTTSSSHRRHCALSSRCLSGCCRTRHRRMRTTRLMTMQRSQRPVGGQGRRC